MQSQRFVTYCACLQGLTLVRVPEVFLPCLGGRLVIGICSVDCAPLIVAQLGSAARADAYGLCSRFGAFAATPKQLPPAVASAVQCRPWMRRAVAPADAASAVAL